MKLQLLFIVVGVSLSGAVPSGPTDCRNTALGTEYIGTKATTINGRKCQPWTSNYPHSHGMHNMKFPDGSEVEAKNYCRNPDNETTGPDPNGGGPWCYTTDPDVRWEYCGIPYCSSSVKPDPKTCSNRGRCGNPCAARGLSCCFCDETKILSIDACFCCPKNHTCCPARTWAGYKAHCCPNGYSCITENNENKCSKLVDIKPQPADGVCGFSCREDTKLYVSVDDKCSVSIDGVFQYLKNANNWTTMDVIDLKRDARVITIFGQNVQYKAGILLACEDPSVLQDAEWKCYGSSSESSKDSAQTNFDDSRWGGAYEDEMNNGEGSRNIKVDGIPETTRYKWCNNPGNLRTSDWAPYCICRIKLRSFNGYGY